MRRGAVELRLGKKQEAPGDPPDQPIQIAMKRLLSRVEAGEKRNGGQPEREWIMGKSVPQKSRL